jgi:hypothetical protein
MRVWFDDDSRVMRKNTAAVTNASNLVLPLTGPTGETEDERMERSVRFRRADEPFLREQRRYLDVARDVLGGRPEKPRSSDLSASGG